MDYRSRLYETYLRTHFRHIRDLSPAAVERQRQTFRHYFGSLLLQDRDARILEVGCGYGLFLDYLRSEGYRNIEGVDISPEQVDAASRLGVSNVTCSDVVSFLKQRSEAYDCVVAIDFIEHFPKQEALEVLDSIYTRLKPGGRLILQTVNAGGPFTGRHRYSDFTHEFSLTATSVNQILEAVSFSDVRVYGMDPFVHGLPSLIRVMVWKVIKAFLWIYLVAETGVLRGHILTQNLIASARKPTT